MLLRNSFHLGDLFKIVFGGRSTLEGMEHKQRANKRIHADCEKRRSCLAMLFASGDAKRYARLML